MNLINSHWALFEALSRISALFPFILWSEITVFSPFEMQIKIVPTGYWLDDIGPASPKIVRATFDLYLFNEDSVRLYDNSSQSSKLIFSSFNNKFLDSFV